MDFIDVTGWTLGDWSPVIWTVVVGAAVITLTLALVNKNDKIRRNLGPILVFYINVMWLVPVTMITLMMGAALIDSTYEAKEREANENRAALIEETYGIELSDANFESLEYPAEKPKVGEVKRFGSIDEDFVTPEGELGQSSMVLAWIDDEFKLFESVDDEALGVELPRV